MQAKEKTCIKSSGFLSDFWQIKKSNKLQKSHRLTGKQMPSKAKLNSDLIKRIYLIDVLAEQHYLMLQ